MSAAAVGFLAWTIFLLVMCGVFFYSAWHSENVDEKTEDAAEECLPEIGRIAERQFRKRTGSNPPPFGDWYPEKKAAGLRR